MRDQTEWVPMRWPAGWTDPSLLRLLEGTPVNCLILPTDSEPKVFEAVVEQGRRAGLDFPMIPFSARLNLPRTAASPVLAVGGNVWPSMKTSSEGAENEADAGPTGAPWVDSNGWFIRMAQALAPGKTIWVAADPPVERPLPAESYMLAVADAAAYGGRWVVSLNKLLAEGLASSNAAAVSAWGSITGALSFFEEHREWRSYEPQGLLAVLSDFSGDNEFLSMEAVNLISRRYLPFRILDKTSLQPQSFQNLKAVLYADQEPPAAPLHEALLAFIKAGGLLISTPAAASLVAGSEPAEQSYARFDVRRLGRGRIAIANEEMPDPYVLAADAHTLLGRRNDLVRAWNAGSTNSYYTASADGRKAVIQILNYISQPARDITLTVRRPYRSARLWTLGSEAPSPLRIIPRRDAVEFHLPPLSVYGAIELET